MRLFQCTLFCVVTHHCSSELSLAKYELSSLAQSLSSSNLLSVQLTSHLYVICLALGDLVGEITHAHMRKQEMKIKGGAIEVTWDVVLKVTMKILDT